MGPRFAARHWYRLSAVSLLLFPLSLVFSLLVRLRRFFYRLGILPSIRLRVPVIVIGNRTVGGTGKTPLVLWLVAELLRQGRRPAILCRGYGAAETGPRAVLGGDSAGRVGDEPLLLASRSQCPVWVGRDRAATGNALLRAHPDCDVIVCDDGLQHYRLQRDIEIAVEDERGHGNSLLLPAGPLREPADRPVDALVRNCEPAARAAGSSASESRMAAHGGGTAPHVFEMRLEPSGFHLVCDPARTVTPGELAGKRLHAVAGIGNPQRFFALLARLGLDPVCHVFPDHHAYRTADLEFADCDWVLMTEKDAVKCARFDRVDFVALRVDAVLDPAFADFLTRTLHGRAPA
jgi:tetraacyldisaccharide 4'-kinase